MTPQQLFDARASLGKLWGLNRPLTAAEMGRALRMTGRDPGRRILDMERGARDISGPVSVAVEMMINGARPGSVRRIIESATAL